MIKSKPSANIIADSVSPNGVRLTTFVVTFHRYVLAELNTHKMISKSSASSRAIPGKVMLERVRNNPAMPISWGSNQPGMQAGAELEGDVSDMLLMSDTERQKQAAPKQEAFNRWLVARNSMMATVSKLTELGLHKQVANRLLEPFNWHTAILTATELDNFFWQRCDPAAQPEFKALADAMQYAYYMGDPAPLKAGQWHLPFADDAGSRVEVLEHIDTLTNQGLLDGARIEYKADSKEDITTELLKQLSVSRCARVSYLNHDGSRAVDKDFDLYDKLRSGMHMSPGEHQGTPCEHIDTIEWVKEGFYLIPGCVDASEYLNVSCKYQGNFSTGWHQLRKFWKDENRKNFIPNLPGLERQAEIIKAGGKLW